ncbi:hypothetical protein SDC9_63080 [bioreactor metagenome]|uniref:Carbohydrate-binding domain-containing protein n=1 Tax=bioreactor metagenome TaxID=1076179 RepID=A0A644XKT0_9ZZZZ
MKKIIALALVAVMMIAFVVPANAAYENPKFTITKVKTAPTLDGVISEGEWTLIATYPKDSSVFASEGKDVDTYNVQIYANWDDANFYFAVVADCKPKHEQIFDNDAGDYIFNKHHVMFSIIQGNPTDAAYIPAAGADAVWDWGDAAAMKDAHEASIALRENGEQVYAEHMGTGFADNVTYFVKSANGKDTYEAKIPFSYFGNTDNTVGGVLGFACEAGLGNATDNDDAPYVYFTEGMSAGKAFQKFAIMTLGAEAAEETPSEETPVETGDEGIAIFAVLAAISAAAIVSKSKKSK